MQTMDWSLMQLVHQGVITREVAKNHMKDSQELEKE